MSEEPLVIDEAKDKQDSSGGPTGNGEAAADAGAVAPSGDAPGTASSAADPAKPDAPEQEQQPAEAGQQQSGSQAQQPDSGEVSRPTSAPASEGDEEEEEFEPDLDMMMNDFDDERTMEEEEALEDDDQRRENVAKEVDALNAEGDMPLEELLKMYGYRNEEAEQDDANKDQEQQQGADQADSAKDKEAADEQRQEQSESANNKDAAVSSSSGSSHSSPSKGPKATTEGAGNTNSSPAVAVAVAVAVAGSSPAKPGDKRPHSEENGKHDEEQNEENNKEEKEGNKVASSSSGTGIGGMSPPPPAKRSKSELAKFYESAVEGRTTRSATGGQAEEEEEDSEVEEGASSDHDHEGRDYSWKKAIMIGPSYQAAVPSGLSSYNGADNRPPPYDDDEDKLLWDPASMNANQVEDYLTVIQQDFAAAHGVASLPVGAHVRDDEQALYVLQKCDHNLDEALRRRRGTIGSGIPFPADSLSLWCEEECRNFELGLRLYGKDFHMIQQQKVRTRSVGELVQFYYLWKKTERHDMFANATRIEKKKYALHPGTTDYMDRFIDETDPPAKDNRSASPNFHSLLYGTSSAATQAQGTEVKKGLILPSKNGGVPITAGASASSNNSSSNREIEKVVSPPTASGDTPANNSNITATTTAAAAPSEPSSSSLPPTGSAASSSEAAAGNSSSNSTSSNSNAAAAAQGSNEASVVDAS